MPRPTLPRPTDGEVEILRVLWEQGKPLSVRDIHAVLRVKREININSVLRRVQIMENKGYIRRGREARPLRYIAVLSEKRARVHFIRDLITRLFNGSAPGLVLHALGSKKLAKSELDEIRKRLEQLED